ncbi:unnamed protein product [Calicophoron daubneyi]|uniref:LMBR1 domain-containing protein 2 n=1 Tax=Calicophoron daubneyi TaxID=300641 RepID=A0AAV2TWQ2_CALDB
MSGNPLATLRRAYFYLSKRSTELVDEEDKLREVVQHVNQIRSGLPLNHPLRPHLLTVLKRVETIQRSSVLSRRGSPTEYPTNSVDVLGLDLGKLAHLHKSLKTAEQRRNRAEALYREAVNSALWIEDVNTYRTKHRVTAFARDHDSEFLLKVHDYVPAVGSALSSAYWYWCCYVRFWLLRLLSVVLALLSIFMVWSECTFFVRSPTLSTVALLLNAEAERRDYFLVEVCSFFTLGYLGLAVFFTVFRLRIFNYYRLVPSHHTDENSLLFCGSLLCRLTPSLCLNFLGLAHLDSHVTRTTLKSPVTMSGSGVPVPADLATSTVNFHTVPCSAGPLHGVVETTYTRFMGHLDVIPFIARGFNVYFPILVLLLCLLTYFRFGDRVLRRLGILQLMDSMSDLDQDTHPADPLVEDSVQDGKLLLREERMFLSRQNRGHSSESEIGLDLHDVTKTSNDGYYHDDQPPDRAQLLLRCSPFGGEPSSTNVDDSRPRKTHASILPVEYSEEAIENEFPLDTDQHSNLKPLR